MTSFKQIGYLIYRPKNKNITLSCQSHNKSDIFILCVLYFFLFYLIYLSVLSAFRWANIACVYIRSNLFETRKMGKVVQHRKNILYPFPDLSNTNCNTSFKLTAAATAPLWCCQKIYLLTKKWKKISFEWKRMFFCLFPL